MSKEPMMHTKDMLAEALIVAGLPKMAERAATGYYHDFLSPLDLPEIQLITELGAVNTLAAMALRQRVISGDFDASAEESDEWAASAEGQETFSKLLSK